MKGLRNSISIPASSVYDDLVANGGAGSQRSVDRPLRHDSSSYLYAPYLLDGVSICMHCQADAPDF